MPVAPRKKKKAPPSLGVVKVEASETVISGGVAKKHSYNRLKGGVSIELVLSKVMESSGLIWGGGKWSSEAVRAALVNLVAEGLSLRDALESMRETFGMMPPFYSLARWRTLYPEFGQAILQAQRLRGELLVEAATETALDALVNPDLDPRNVKNLVEQLRWHASKLDRDTFGEHRTVEVNQPMAALSDKDLEARIKALMADPQVRGVLNAQGFEVLDVEVVEEAKATA